MNRHHESLMATGITGLSLPRWRAVLAEEPAPREDARVSSAQQPGPVRRWLGSGMVRFGHWLERAPGTIEAGMGARVAGDGSTR